MFEQQILTDLISFLILLFIAASLFLLIAQCYWIKISPLAPSWLVALFNPARTYSFVIALLFVMVVIRTIDISDGWKIDGNTFSGCMVLLFLMYYIAVDALPNGARIAWEAHDPMLSWWMDREGQLHPHLMSGRGSIPRLQPNKAAVELLSDQIQLAGHYWAKPIKLKTPFKLGYLTRNLSRQGWSIEHHPSTPVHPAMRAMLCFRRRKSGRTWQCRWQDCAVINHAVLYPPTQT